MGLSSHGKARGRYVYLAYFAYIAYYFKQNRQNKTELGKIAKIGAKETSAKVSPFKVSDLERSDTLVWR